MKIKFTHLPEFPEFLLSIEKDGLKYDISISKSSFREIRIDVRSMSQRKWIGSYLYATREFLNEEMASDLIIEEHEKAKKSLLNERT